MRARAIAAIAVIGLTATLAQAAPLYSTGFDTPTYSDGALIGQDGWVITGTSTVNAQAVSNTATDGVVGLTTTGQDTNRPFTAAGSDPSGTVYYGVDINLSAAQATGDYFIHLSDGGSSLFYGRLYAKSSGSGYVLALATSSGTPTTYGSTVLNFGTEYRAVVRYDLVSGLANDTGAIYIDPTDSTEGNNTAYAAANTIGTDATSMASFAAIALRQGSASNAPTVTVDDINVATDFATASAIPEPATFAVLGLGAMGMLLRRRRA